MPHKSTDQEMQRCVEACLDCYRACKETLAHCLQMGGKHADAKHIRILMDCAEICKLSADYMMGGSEFYKQVCGLCAEICKRWLKVARRLTQTMNTCDSVQEPVAAVQKPVSKWRSNFGIKQEGQSFLFG